DGATARELLLAAAGSEQPSDLTPLLGCVLAAFVALAGVSLRAPEARLPVALRSEADPALEPKEQLTGRILTVRQGRPVYPEGGPGQLDPGSQRPFRFQLVGHQVRWQVGPRVVDTEDQLRQELLAAHANRELWPPDPLHPGARKPLPVVIEP